MSHVPIGAPIRPPDMIPHMAAAIATVAAPGTPARSKSGANASPVAGPPVSVTELQSTPNNGCMPRGTATRIPAMFCTTANKPDTTKNRTTWGPPTLRRDRLAQNPMVVKNAIMRGV